MEKSNKNKGGRPTLPDYNKKSKGVQVRFTPVDLIYLRSCAVECGLRLAEYIYRAVMNQPTTKLLTKDEMAIIADIRNIGNNLNQITRSVLLNGFRISGSKLGLHNKFTYGNLCKQFGQIDASPAVAQQPGVVKQRNIVYIPVIRYIEILSHILPKGVNGRGENREHEVGQRGRSWQRIDDHIEEETTSYKFKM